MPRFIDVHHDIGTALTPDDLAEIEERMKLLGYM